MKTETTTTDPGAIVEYPTYSGTLTRAQARTLANVRRERVRVTSRRAVIVTDWEAPDAFDGLGWSNRTLELAPTSKERSASK